MHTYLDRLLRPRYNQLREQVKKWLDTMHLKGMANRAHDAAQPLINSGTLFEDMGFRYFGPVDGHDIAATELLLKRVGELSGPRLVHVHTKKGAGWDIAEQDPLKWHGPKGFDPKTGKSLQATSTKFTTSILRLPPTPSRKWLNRAAASSLLPPPCRPAPASPEWPKPPPTASLTSASANSTQSAWYRAWSSAACCRGSVTTRPLPNVV